jgi:hypothetical protein
VISGIWTWRKRLSNQHHGHGTLIVIERADLPKGTGVIQRYRPEDEAIADLCLAFLNSGHTWVEWRKMRKAQGLPR